MVENKEDIVKRLKPLLMATRAGSGIADLILSESQNDVIILFRQGGIRKIDITADSGIAIIKDVVSRL